jgi:hypothetical protein
MRGKKGCWGGGGASAAWRGRVRRMRVSATIWRFMVLLEGGKDSGWGVCVKMGG